MSDITGLPCEECDGRGLRTVHISGGEGDNGPHGAMDIDDVPCSWCEGTGVEP